VVIKKFRFELIILLGVVFSLAACAGRVNEPGEIVIVSSHEKRPEWTFIPPEGGAEHPRIYFVGISEYQSYEREARNQARKDARHKITEYLAAEISQPKIKKNDLQRLSGRYEITDIYIQKIFRLQGYRWKVYILASYPKQAIENISSTPDKQKSKKEFPEKVKKEEEKQDYGRVLWKKSVKNSPSGEAVKSSPAFDKAGNVYFINDGILYCFSPAGSLKWKYTSGNNKVRGTPLLTEPNLLLASNSRGISTFDTRGAFKFKTSNLTGISSISLGPHGRYYISSGAKGGYLAAVGKEGEMEWKYKVGEKDRTVLGAAISPQGIAYFTTKERLGRGHGYLYAVKPDGSLKWKYQYKGESRTVPAIGNGGTVYATIVSGGGYKSTDGHLYAFSPTGELKWKFKTGSEVTHLNNASYRGEANPVIGPDGTVYVASNRTGKIWALDENGNQKWEFNTGSPIRSTPAIGDNGCIYFGNDNGTVYALDSEGNLKWKLELGSRIFSSPVISRDGILYLAGWDDLLYAIQTSAGGLAASPWPAYQHDNQNTGRSNIAADLGEDLFTHFSLDEPSGGKVFDKSKNEFHALNYGAEINRPGKLFRSFFFDGQASHIRTAPSFNRFGKRLENPHTVSFWIKSSARAGSDYRIMGSNDQYEKGGKSSFVLIMNHPGNTAGTGLYVFITDDKNDSGVRRDITDYWVDVDFSDGGWHHLAVVQRDIGNAQFEVYLDGKRCPLRINRTETGNNFSDFDYDFIIGTTNLSGGLTDKPFFKGYLDDIRFYTRALSGREIRNLFMSNFVSKENSACLPE